MGKSALVVALLALGVSAFAVYGQGGLDGRIADVSEGQQALDARLIAIERGLAELRASAAPAEPLAAPTPTPEDASAAGDAPTLTGAPRPAPRVASVEQRLAKLEGELAAARKQAAKPEGNQAFEIGGNTFTVGNHGFLGSMDQAAKQLGLDGGQRSDLERVVEGVKRELEALRERPNEEGVTMKQLQEGLELEGGWGEEGMAAFHEHMAKVTRFRGTKLPGTNETYAQAERRIKKDGKARARSYLSPEQAKTWDKSHTDALFGGGDGMTASVVVMDGPAIEIAAPPGR